MNGRDLTPVKYGTVDKRDSAGDLDDGNETVHWQVSTFRPDLIRIDLMMDDMLLTADEAITLIAALTEAVNRIRPIP